MTIAAVILRASFLMGVLGLGLAAASSSQEINCDNFYTQEDAQAHLNADPSDPDGLDGDDDGIACESLPHATDAPTTSTVPLPQQGTFEGLRVKPESRQGYIRPTGSYNRQDLLHISLAAHTCYLSVADKFCHGSADDVEVDHLVSLAEAWDSRPDGWRHVDLHKFSIDTDNLWLMTRELNREKSDKDAADWLPPVPEQVCPYVTKYLRVKKTYDFAVDTAERDALIATGCIEGVSATTSSGAGGGGSASGGGTYSESASNGSDASGATDAVGGLPFTGPGLAPIAFAIGGVLLVGGSVAFVVTRRRRGDSPIEDASAYPQLWEDPVQRWARGYDDPGT